jgi:hypothetical protein
MRPLLCGRAALSSRPFFLTRQARCLVSYRMILKVERRQQSKPGSMTRL